jgi:hypothetical protein
VSIVPSSVTATQVDFTIPSTYLGAATTFPVVYVNPAAGGGNSAAQTFTVN